MPARPGAFTANFAPETLNKFREICKRSGLQYTKVLEELASIYLESDGRILHYKQQTETLQYTLSREKDTINEIIKFLDSKELLDTTRKEELEQLIEKTQRKHAKKHVQSWKANREQDESRIDQLRDSSIERASPPDELTTWEEGYGDLLKKILDSDRKLRSLYRQMSYEHRKDVNDLQSKVASLEEHLSKLQSEFSD